MKDKNMDKLQVLQIAQAICKKHGCDLLGIDFEKYEVQIEGPTDKPEVRAACIEELTQMLAMLEEAGHPDFKKTGAISGRQKS